ncbi:MAG: eukaryotic-like serine/threonine-protein kinase [Actinomycetota bacterium]
MTSAAVRLSPSGRLEVVRRAPPEDPVRLAATVERLQRAAGTGVVDLVGVESSDDGDLTIVLAHAGAPIARPLGASDAARLGASAAATLADLHARGMIHGAVRAEHVLRDAAGTVRLCGLGEGAGEPADDVAALGALLRELLEQRETTAAARDLRVLLDRCTVDDPLARPTASAVAAALAATAPAPRTIERPVAPRAPARPLARAFSWRGTTQNGVPLHRYRELVVMVSAVVVAIAIGLVLARWPKPARADAAPSTASLETTSTSTTSTTTAAVDARRVWPLPGPNVLHANGSWTFGTTDDHVLIGDWNCDGVETPALLQPDGDVYVVDEWTDDAAARLVTTIAGAVDARIERSGTCDRLVIVTDDGRTVTPTMDGS